MRRRRADRSTPKPKVASCICALGPSRKTSPVRPGPGVSGAMAFTFPRYPFKAGCIQLSIVCTLPILSTVSNSKSQFCILHSSFIIHHSSFFTLQHRPSTQQLSHRHIQAASHHVHFRDIRFSIRTRYVEMNFFLSLSLRFTYLVSPASSLQQTLTKEK
jgi:hypothetical protein